MTASLMDMPKVADLYATANRVLGYDLQEVERCSTCAAASNAATRPTPRTGLAGLADCSERPGADQRDGVLPAGHAGRWVGRTRPAGGDPSKASHTARAASGSPQWSV
jgi:hypothetical protein